MEQIIQELAKLDAKQGEYLLKLIKTYGQEQWMSGWNKAIDTASYGAPPEPTVRNEVRNNLNNVGV